MFLSPELYFAVEQEIAKLDTNHLIHACQELIQYYRQKDFEKYSLLLSKEHCVAYAATRMPATYQVATQIFTQLCEQLPSLSITSLLDIGAGPGTCGFAFSQLQELEQVTFLEKETHFLELGKRLCQQSNQNALKNASWSLQDAASTAQFPKSDLTLASYSLGEITPESRKIIIDKCIQATQKVLVVIEPGTPRGYKTIIDVRNQLLAHGLFIVAPCPHQNPCPLQSPDWCHFSKRLSRSNFHRLIKNVELNYEDEKYCYLIATKEKCIQPDFMRIIKKPMKRPGHTYLDFCTKNGLKREIVTRTQKEKMRKAQKAQWGDMWMYV